jgi:hypothetical protein
MKLVNVVILAVCANLIIGCSGPLETLGSDKKSGSEKTLSADELSGSDEEASGLSVGVPVADKYALENARICDPSGCYIAWRVVDSDHDGVSDADELMAGTDPYDAKSRPRLIVVAELRGKEQLPSFEAGLGAFVVFPPELQTMIEKTKDDPLGDIMVAFPLTKERSDTLTRLGISSELMVEHGVDVTSDGFTIGPLVKSKETGGFEPRMGGVEIRLISDDDHCCYPLLPIEPDAPKTDLGDGDTVTNFSDGSYVFDFADGSGAYVNADNEIVVTWYVNPDADPVSEVPTPEQEEAFKRLRGATILTLDNWYGGPEVGDEEFGDPYETIILVDPEYAYDTAMVFSSPVVNEAQPEGRDDLPRPDVPAIPGECLVGCE